MDQRILSMYISRILSGYYIFTYNNTKYKLIYPDTNIKYEAELYANDEFDKNKFNDWITEKDILDYLVNMNLCTYGTDDNLKKIEEQIDNLKVDLYKNFLNPTKLKSIRRTLSNTKGSYNRSYSVRHSLDQYTVEGYIQSLKNNYILVNSIFDTNNNKIFTCYDETDYRLLNEISLTISENIIDVSVFREIARSDNWKNYWSANKDNLFNRSTINWTDEQRTLVILTKMYDSAMEHPECPPDSIFEDDDMFDGWMIVQRKENEKLRNKNRTEKLLEGKKLDKAGEIFVMAKSKEEASSIFDLNDPNARNIIKERQSILVNTNKEINEAELPDVKRNLVMQANQQFKNSRKS
jgi:hypothetical protein